MHIRLEFLNFKLAKFSVRWAKFGEIGTGVQAPTSTF